MILVHRICVECGRRFSFWRKPGIGSDMPKLCLDCHSAKLD